MPIEPGILQTAAGKKCSKHTHAFSEKIKRYDEDLQAQELEYQDRKDAEAFTKEQLGEQRRLLHQHIDIELDSCKHRLEEHLSKKESEK